MQELTWKPDARVFFACSRDGGARESSRPSNVLVEILAIRGIGGNAGAFLFVTWHFGLAPLLAAAASIVTLVAAARSTSLPTGC